MIGTNTLLLIIIFGLFWLYKRVEKEKSIMIIARFTLRAEDDKYKEHFKFHKNLNLLIVPRIGDDIVIGTRDNPGQCEHKVESIILGENALPVVTCVEESVPKGELLDYATTYVNGGWYEVMHNVSPEECSGLEDYDRRVRRIQRTQS